MPARARPASPARVGCLALALWLAWGLAAGDVAFYGVVKLHQYEQAPSGGPQLLASNAFAFEAFVVPATNYAVTNATVKPPGATPARVLWAESNGLAFRYEERFDAQPALDAAYPSSGSLFNPSVYALAMQTAHDGAQSGSVSYWLVTTPPTPEVSNLDQAQAIDTTADFTLQWSLAGGTLLDIVELLVVDARSNFVFASPAPFQPGALNGASTAGLIPANTLPPGADLFGHLVIARPGLPNTNSCPGAIGIAALAKDVAFPLAARPAPAPPRLLVISSNAAPFQLRVLGETNRNYHLQATADFGSWQELWATNSPTGCWDFTDPQSAAAARRFYRVRVGP